MGSAVAGQCRVEPRDHVGRHGWRTLRGSLECGPHGRLGGGQGGVGSGPAGISSDELGDEVSFGPGEYTSGEVRDLIQFGPGKW
jgi:hypothetical protein